MGNVLRSEILTPIHSQTYRLITASLGCGVISAVVALAVAAPKRAITPPPPTVAQPAVAAPVEPPPATPAGTVDVQLVFRAAGTTYMKLADAADVRHGALKMFDRGEADDWRTFSIARVSERDVPVHHRAWIGADVIVDGTCHARVSGFAVVARLTGVPDYAGVAAEHWTAATAFEHGAPVLAAKLDGCRDGTLARAATAPPIIALTTIEDPALAHRARTKLLASAPAQTAQLEWAKEESHSGEWQHAESTTIKTIVARHPTTGVTWVSVHARVEEGCGGADINLWGLYRVDGDQLVTVQERGLGEVYSVDNLIDLDGDGALEFIGKPWLGTDTVVSRASGEELARLALPYYGCPC